MHACPLETHRDGDNGDVAFKNESDELRMHKLAVNNHTEADKHQKCMQKVWTIVASVRRPSGSTGRANGIIIR